MQSWFRAALWMSGLFVAFLTALPTQSFAQTHPANCNRAASEPLTYVTLPGRPFSAVPTGDGCWIFVSLTPTGAGAQGEIALLHRSGGMVSLVRVIPIRSHPAGMVLTHDGQLLIAADDDGVVILDVGLIISGRERAVLGYFGYSINPVPVTAETRRFVASQMGLEQASKLRSAGSIYVNVTADDRFVFVSDEWVQTITVINLEKARHSNFAPDSVVGRIPVGVAPIALTFSSDEHYLYTTSEAAPQSFGWPAECKPEGQDPSAKAQPDNPPGAILVVDVATAKSKPQRAVVAKVPTGCTPVRLAASRTGDKVYVTARNSDALLAFETRRLISDPAHAQIGTVPVGIAPVGIAVVDRGNKIIVTNSNRFSGSTNNNETLTVIEAAKIASGAAAVVGTIPANGFPRELMLTADKQSLLVTNYSSQTLEVVDLTRQPLVANEKKKKRYQPHPST
jgi:DNA-binding beta-propeller fold protein YncE